MTFLSSYNVKKYNSIENLRTNKKNHEIFRVMPLINITLGIGYAVFWGPGGSLPLLARVLADKTPGNRNTEV